MQELKELFIMQNCSSVSVCRRSPDPIQYLLSVMKSLGQKCHLQNLLKKKKPILYTVIFTGGNFAVYWKDRFIKAFPLTSTSNVPSHQSQTVSQDTNYLTPSLILLSEPLPPSAQITRLTGATAERRWMPILAAASLVRT